MYLHQLSDDDLMDAMQTLEEFDYNVQWADEVNYLSNCIWAKLQAEDTRRINLESSYEDMLNEGYAMFMEEQCSSF